MLTFSGWWIHTLSLRLRIQEEDDLLPEVVLKRELYGMPLLSTVFQRIYRLYILSGWKFFQRVPNKFSSSQPNLNWWNQQVSWVWNRMLSQNPYQYTDWTCIICQIALIYKSMKTLYKYWQNERVRWEIVTPRKPMSTKAGVTISHDTLSAAQLRHAIRGRGLIWSGNVDCDITYK